MGINSNVKSPAWYGDAGLSSFLRPGANRGNIYYVFGLDGSIGNNANSGLRPDVPLLTIKAALAKCTNEMHDNIVVLDYWQPTGEDWPIVIDKTTVGIVGGFTGSFLPWACIVPVGDFAAFQVEATCHIQNLYFSGGASHGCIEIVDPGTGGPQRCSILHCYLGFGTPLYGVYSANQGCGMGTEIAYCEFASAITGGGIVLGNPPWSRFHNNVFHSVGTVGISLSAAGSCEILNNVIACDADTQGHGITLGAGCTDCIVDGNHANFGDTDMAANPYLDSAAAGINNWMLNYKGVTATLPA